MANIFVTGASGYIGRHFCATAAAHKLFACSRSALPGTHLCAQFHADLTETDFKWFPQGIDCVVHLAGRAHKLRDDASDPLQQFRSVNRDATLKLAEAAHRCGVKRFIFISSIGVNGQSAPADAPIHPDSPAKPAAPYALSKLEAEQQLIRYCESAGMEWVIVRPPLVYGADAPGNFARLLTVVARKWPLPFANVRNARSIISVGNLVDFIELCCHHEHAAGQVFTIADAEPLGTKTLVTQLASSMGHRPVFFALPKALVRTVCKAAGRSSLHQQLFGDLVVDASKAASLLGWVAPQSSSQALRQAALGWVRQKEQSS